MDISTIVHFSNTTLKKESYGKAEPNRGDLSLNVTLNTHIPANPKDRLVRYYASLAQNGTISIHRMILTWLKNNRTNTTNNISKPLFVAHSMDPREYQSYNGSTIYADGNRHTVDIALQCNPWNSINIQGKIASLKVPNSKSSWDNDKHNAHVFTLIERLQTIQATTAPEATLAQAYKETWDAYLQAEQSLLEEGILAESNVIVADQNSISFAVTVAQDVKYRDSRYNASELFGNKGQLASYVHTLNDVNGTLMFTESLQDARSAYEYGLRESAINGEKTIKTFSSEVVAFDFLNKESEIPLSISVSDLPYQTQRSRAENFQEFKDLNTFFDIRKGTLTLRSVSGSLATTFHITGDDMTYRAREIKGLELYENPSMGSLEILEINENDSQEDEF